MLTLLALAISIHGDFEGGSIGKVEQLAPGHFRCAVEGESDQDKRNRQANWYYFRVDAASGQPLTIDLVDLVGEYNYRPGTHAVTKNTRPVYSYDRRNWRNFTGREVAWDETEVRLRIQFTPERSPVWIAHVAPYVVSDLDRLLAEFRRHPALKIASAGRTAGRREIPLLTITEGGEKVVWLMFRQHAWESHTSWVCEGAVRFLLSEDPEAARIRREFVFKIFPMADPDGVARGGVRFNAHGYDLNRNWDAVDAKRTPEIAAQRKAVLDWVDSGRRIDLFLAFHNTESAEYLTGRVPALAQRLSEALKRTTTFNPTRGPSDSGATTTPGRMTVEQGLYHDRKIPALLMEQMVEYNPRLGRVPTVDDRLEFGRALVKAIATAL